MDDNERQKLDLKVLELLVNRLAKTQQKYTDKLRKAEQKQQESEPILGRYLG